MEMQPQVHPQIIASRMFGRDIDDMSWVATNSMKMPMNDMLPASQKKGKLPMKAVTGMGMQPQFHP